MTSLFVNSSKNAKISILEDINMGPVVSKAFSLNGG